MRVHAGTCICGLSWSLLPVTHEKNVATTGFERIARGIYPLAKHKVAGSTPVTRSFNFAHLARYRGAEMVSGYMHGYMQACTEGRGGDLHLADSTAACIFSSAANCAASCVMQ